MNLPTDISIQKMIAIFILATFIIHLTVWEFVPLPNIASDKVLGMLQTMLGLHGGWCAMIVNYYFSSSASSARKDEIIAASAPVNVDTMKIEGKGAPNEVKP